MAILEAALPVILQLISLGISKWGAEQAQLKDFEALVVNSAKQGLLSESTKQTFLDQVTQLNLKAQRPPQQS